MLRPSVVRGVRWSSNGYEIMGERALGLFQKIPNWVALCFIVQTCKDGGLGANWTTNDPARHLSRHVDRQLMLIIKVLNKLSSRVPFQFQFKDFEDSELLGMLEKSLAQHYSKTMEVEGEEFVLRPMNCPHHCEIYRSQEWSYRDLPKRFAEFGTVYRYEKSGELHGLTRVRSFTQDDAHIFCTNDQLLLEFKNVIKLMAGMKRSNSFRVN